MSQNWAPVHWLSSVHWPALPVIIEIWRPVAPPPLLVTATESTLAPSTKGLPTATVKLANVVQALAPVRWATVVPLRDITQVSSQAQLPVMEAVVGSTPARLKVVLYV
jgi:hypothetical protein